MKKSLPTHGLSFLLIVSVISGCFGQSEQESDLPEHLRDIENLTVFSPNTHPADSVVLIRETVFESGDDVYMSGFVSEFDVDDSDRVYINSSVPSNLGVYIFNADGSYLTKLGRFGKGPGEFEAVGSLHIENNQLTLFDPRLQKFAVYSLEDYELMKEELIKREGIADSDSLFYRSRGSDLFVTDDGPMILRLHMSSLTREQDIPKILFYELSPNGYLLPDMILDLDRHPLYFTAYSERFTLPVTMPFTRSSLVAVTPEGDFYTAWTEDFLIRKYDRDGNYIQSFYYPVEKSRLSLDQIDIRDHELEIIRNYEMPETWPVLHTMELDDQGKFWVATITDSEESFKWWVLNPDGELIAHFTLPGERNSRFVRSQPEIVIKNGYFYTRERDVLAGINRIVKHRIDFIERTEKTGAL